MHIKAIILHIVLLLIVIIPSSVSANDPDKGIESCFSYYNYGKIKADLSSDKPEYSSQDSINLRGSIENNNTFPLVDVVLYAQIRRLNESNDAQLYGQYFIDRLILKEGLNFLAKDRLPIKLTLPVKKTYPNGKYRIQYFLVSKESFHYGGRPFLEEDFGGSTDFIIKGNGEPVYYFDPKSLKVNGEPHTIKEQIYEFTSKPLLFEVKTIDLRAEKKVSQAKIKLYSFDDTFEDKLVTQQQIDITPDKPITFSFNPPEAGAYVIVIETNNPLQSILKYRFAYKTTEESTLRINDLGITDFPVVANSRAWVCFHSPTPENSTKTTITLSLLNNAQKVIDQVSVTDSFDGEVRAISLPLTKLTNKTDFWVETIFYEEDGRKRSRPVRMHYECSRFPGSLTSLDVRHEKDNPGELIINGITGCGTKTTDEIVFDVIRIRRGDLIVKEDYNLTLPQQRYSLGLLSAGSYSADIKAGDIKSLFNFTLDAPIIQTTPQTSKKSNLNIMIIVGLGIITVLIIGALYISRKK